MAGFDITNMAYTGASAPPKNVVDGWAAILDRDGVVPGTSGPTKNIFFCLTA